MNVDRLIKLLEMLSSDQDGEALNAGRMASKIVKESGKQWKDLIGAQPEQQTQPATRPAQAPQSGAAYGSPFGMGQAWGAGMQNMGAGHPFQQQYDPFAQQRSQYDAYQAAMAAQQREEILRQQAYAQQNAWRPPETPKEEPPKIDDSLKAKEEKKRGFWRRYE